jgi:hypothetical protein
MHDGQMKFNYDVVLKTKEFKYQYLYLAVLLIKALKIFWTKHLPMDLKLIHLLKGFLKEKITIK